MRVAVTGAAGFVGINLVRHLVAQGDEVQAIDRVCSDKVSGAELSWVDADVLDVAAMRQALQGVEIVYHLVAKITLAAYDDFAWTLNTKGVRTVAEAAHAAGARRMVHCSSVHAFDQYRCDGRIDESARRSTDPSIPVYDRSKWAGEQELHQVIDAGLDAVICNPTGVFGPVDYGLSRFNGILRNAARGLVPIGVGGGYDFVDVRDVVNGLVAAADKGRTGENYLLCGHQLTLLEACRQAAGGAGRRGPAFAVPLGLIKTILPVVEPIGRRLGSDALTEAGLSAAIASPLFDGSKAATELGYAPRPSEESIRDLVAFFVESAQLGRRPLARSTSTSWRRARSSTTLDWPLRKNRRTNSNS